MMAATFERLDEGELAMLIGERKILYRRKTCGSEYGH
jgi:hypothetical protein